MSVEGKEIAFYIRVEEVLGIVDDLLNELPPGSDHHSDLDSAGRYLDRILESGH